MSELIKLVRFTLSLKMKFLLLAVSFGVLVATVYSATLKFAIVLHRHGDRTPNTVYPTDPYPASIWEKGFGQLTNRGKNQMYDLGKYIRNRYIDFLPVIYNEEDIEAISSGISRTLMSAYVTLAGLYEPQYQDVWSDSIDWQPIPVHSIPTAQDNLLLDSMNCTEHARLLEEYLETNPKIMGSYKNIMKEVSQFAGISLRNNNLDILSQGVGIYDTLLVEQTNNLTLPEWTRNYYPEPLREIATTAMAAPAATKELQRLQCGPLVKEILKLFNGVKKGTLGKKLYHFSAHDSTIAGLLQCLNVYDGEMPPYASAVFLELYDQNDVPEISVTYKKEDVVKKLTIPGCNNMVRCPLDLFEEIVSDVIPDDWETECESV